MKGTEARGPSGGKLGKVGLQDFFGLAKLSALHPGSVGTGVDEEAVRSLRLAAAGAAKQRDANLSIPGGAPQRSGDTPRQAALDRSIPSPRTRLLQQDPVGGG